MHYFTTYYQCHPVRIHFTFTTNSLEKIMKYTDPHSPRAQTLLFMFLSANGLVVVSIVETSQEFKKQSLTKNNLSVFSEFSLKHGYGRKIRTYFLEITKKRIK